MNTIEIHLTRVPVVQQNENYLRHGEWLFVPSPGLVVEASRIRRHAAFRNEAPVVEELYRTGGEAAYASATQRRVLTVPQYCALLRQRPAAVREDWRIVQRDVTAYGRGAVRCARHGAITLPGWHRILLNTEAPALTGQRPPVFARRPAGSISSRSAGRMALHMADAEDANPPRQNPKQNIVGKAPHLQSSHAP